MLEARGGRGSPPVPPQGLLAGRRAAAPRALRGLLGAPVRPLEWKRALQMACGALDCRRIWPQTGSGVAKGLISDLKFAPKGKVKPWVRSQHPTA